MPRVFVKAAGWVKLTARHKLAVIVLAFWAALTLRVFLSFDPAWIIAQTGNYSVLTMGALGFAATLFGLTKWADVQMAQILPSGVPG